MTDAASSAMPDDLSAALAAGDADAVRRLLSSTTTPASAAPPQNPLVTKAARMADDLLARGVATLEREASRDEAAPAPSPSSAPPLRLDELGLVLCDEQVMGQPVWPAALALSRWLLAPARGALCAGARVCELGAGCGAPGLVAARRSAASLVLTDGDEALLPLMARNIALNELGGCDARARRLDWREPSQVDALRAAEAPADGFDLLLAADVLFSVGDVAPLVAAATALLKRGAASRLVIARSAFFEDLQPTLAAAAEAADLCVLSATSDAAAGAVTLELGWEPGALERRC